MMFLVVISTSMECWQCGVTKWATGNQYLGKKWLRNSIWWGYHAFVTDWTHIQLVIQK